MKKIFFLFVLSTKIILAQNIFFYDSTTINNILYYPSLNSYYPSTLLSYKKDRKTFPLIYNHGILIGGKIDNELTIGGVFGGWNTFEAGGYDLPVNNFSNRIFKLLKDWDKKPLDNDKQQRLLNDIKDWPGEFGAPFIDINNSGSFEPGIDEIRMWGNEMFWYVTNLYSEKNMSFYLTQPMPVEVHTTISSFSFNHILKDVLFIRYKIINKGINTISDSYIGHYVDVDILSVKGTFVGIDSSLNLAYGYSVNEFDSLYNIIPQSIGCLLLQGAKIPGSISDSASFDFKWIKNYSNLNLSSFSPIYRFGDRFYIYTKEILFNLLKGLKGNGEPIVNPITNSPTLFPLDGNPVTGEGWFGELDPSDFWNDRDYRFLINIGPFEFAPKDTQEIVYAFIVAEGESNLDAINKLIQKAKSVKLFYNYYNTSFTSLKSFEEPIPEYYKLSQNYPNPFNPSTEIEFEIPMKGFVSLKIFNILGEEITDLINNELDTGSYSIPFNSNINGIKLPSGIYFYTLSVREYSKTKKMVLLK